MSDPPPKKVGSLRDRIAAFENKGGAPTPAPAPVPRPKPGHINWQPKPASPPSSPRRDSADDGAEAKRAGMSAADAKESIGKLSLKERMAALQGSAAFGGPAGAPPPRPTSEKPKWKPPPVVQRVEPVGGDDDEQPAAAATPAGDEAIKAEKAGEARSPPATEEGKEGEGDGEQKDEGEPDPEEEERQRRAALAARMARLGGARVGMAPPIFGKKPDIPPKKIQREEEKPRVDEQPKEEEKATPVASQDEEKPPVVSPSVQEAAAIALPQSDAAEDSTNSASTDYFPPVRKGSDASSLLSPESTASPPPVRSPAMPVPQAPKRAAPPRKRPAKSPSPAPAPVIEQELQESPAAIPTTDDASTTQKPDEPGALKDPQEPESAAPHGDHEPEVTESQVTEVVAAAVASAPAKEEIAGETAPPSEPTKLEALEEPHAPEAAETVADVEHVTEEPTPAHDDTEESITVAPTDGAHPKEHVEQHVEEPEPVEAEAPAEEPEEDEAARRKRIAERLAKSGGFNPFAGGLPPPVLRRDSADSARSPPPPARRDSQHEAVKSPTLSATSPKPELPERKASVGSVQSGLELPSRKQSLDDGGVSAEPHAFEQSIAPAREVHAEPIEEAYGDEDEAADTRAVHEVDDRRGSFANEREDEEYDDRADHEIARETQQEEPEALEETEEEPAEEHAPSPPAPRPLPTAPSAHPGAEEEEDALSPPPPPRRNFPPPPPRAAAPPPEEDDDEEQVYARHAREVGPEHEEGRRHSHDEGDEQLARSSGEQAPYGDESAAEHEDQEPHDEYVPPPPPPRHAAVPPPPPPAPVEEEDDEEEEPVAPAPPPRRSSVVPLPPPTHAPPPVQEYEEVPEDAEPEDNIVTEEPAPPPPPRQTRPRPQVSTSPPTSAAKPISPRDDDLEDHELLNDSDGDPIDPGFYSPQKSAGSVSLPATSPVTSHPPPPARVVSPPPPPPQRVVSPPPPPPQRVVSPPPQRVVSPPPLRVVSPPAEAEEDVPPPVSATRPPAAPPAAEQEDIKEEEDAEQARRRTIAERMAKLGGIRFGAPPPMPAVRRPAPPEPDAEAKQEEGEDKTAEPEEAPQEEEEDEFARKQRIAARIAGMGGMRFGMLPGAAPPKPAPRVHREEEEAEEAKSPAPPKRSAPVPPPPPPPPGEDEHEEESDYQHVSDSDRVGHDSELEEVTYTDAEEEEAPPVPDRGGRRVSTGPPPVPQARPLSPPVASPPPVPRTRPPAPPAFTYPPPPHAPPPPAMQETQGDFVMVNQAENVDELPPPPPSRAARPPPRAPPRAPPAESGVAESQEQNASIPNIDFGGETDLSLSGQWSEDSTQYPPAPPGRSPAAAAAPEQPPSAPARSAPLPAERHLTPDELQAHWGRVGVQVHEVSASYYEKSKKHVVGDGSYVGFVHAVLSQVPNAAQPTESLDSFGYLVYSQSAAAVQRRVSDIMPGDVFVVNDAKFKGHKGLQSYNQTVGVGAPLVGIVSDFESKKSKVKVYQANQHVGQQSVESVSYRLEDLKSGSVKIFRVLEA